MPARAPHESPTTSRAGDFEAESFIRGKLHGGKTSSLRKYALLVIGRPSLLGLLKYELITTLFGPIPGALGLLLRKIFYRFLFRGIGRGVVFGRNVVIRNADKITLGEGVVIDDETFLDARGAGEEGVVIGDHVIIARNCYVQSKVGPIHIGQRTDVGYGTTLVSMGGLYIGEHVAIAGGAKISGGLVRLDPDPAAAVPVVRYSKGPIHIGSRSYLGMGCSVLDGVTLGEQSVVGTLAVVTKDLKARHIATPRPMLILKNPDLGASGEAEESADPPADLKE